MVTNPRTCLIDASTAHRTAPGWVYGLPELAPGQRAAIRTAKRISNPGCHASAFILLLRPLIDAGVLPRTCPVTATSITGYSGGGKKMIEEYQAAAQAMSEALLAGHGNPVLGAPRPYGLKLAHKHLPEMVAHTGLASKPVFVPIVSNFYKGLAVTVPLPLAQIGIGATAIQAAYDKHYAGERFVRVMPMSDPATLEGGFFDVQACNDTNRVDVFVFGGDEQALLIARLDNLGKGASGAAVQSMNVHLGVDEALGLETVGSSLTT
jgi:N-acetyl-gamma-glutamyl-phosphate reductase